MLAKPPTPVIAHGSLASGLVLGLPTAEGGGATTVYDYSGQGNNSTLNGGVTWAGGQNGYCLSFNGSTGYVDCGTPAAFSPTTTGSLTVAAWVNFADLSSSHIISSKGSASNFEWMLGFTSVRDVEFLCWDQNGNTVSRSTNPGTTLVNTWYHVAGVVTNANGTPPNTWLYINGTLVAHNTATNSNFSMAAGSGHMNLGRRDDGVQYLNGYSDAHTVYSRALLQPEIAALAFDSFQMYRPIKKSWLKGVAGPPPPTTIAPPVFDFLDNPYIQSDTLDNPYTQNEFTDNPYIQNDLLNIVSP